MRTLHVSILASALLGALLLGADAAAQRAGNDADPPARGTRDDTQDAGRAAGGTQSAAQQGQRGQPERQPERQADPQATRPGGEAVRTPDAGAGRDAPERTLDRAQLQKAAAMMAQEERAHRQHMAKVAALRRHFQAKGMDDKVRLCDELERKQLARHEERLQRARLTLGDDRYAKLRDYVGNVNRERKAAILEKIQQIRKENAGEAPGRDGTRGDEPNRDGTRGDPPARDGSGGGGAADRDGSRGGDAGGRGGDSNPRGGNDRDGNRGGGR